MKMLRNKKGMAVLIYGGIALAVIIAIVILVFRYPNQECGTVSNLVGRTQFRECPSGLECVPTEQVPPEFHCVGEGVIKYFVLLDGCSEATLQQAQEIGGRLFTTKAECLEEWG